MDTMGFATSILTRAVTFDNTGRYTESLVCYQEGIDLLLEKLKTSKYDANQLKLRARVEEYMARAEKIKAHIEQLKTEGKYKEQIKIEENSIGHSYVSVFSRFLDSSVSQIEIDDSYVRSPHQCDNFLRFVELCVKNCPKLTSITLKTGPDPKQLEQQSQRFRTIETSLQTLDSRQVQLKVHYSDSIHDREIRIDNGWVIKIGRGLDYFKPVDRFNVGWSDYDLRPCKETTVDIFHRTELTRCR